MPPLLLTLFDDDDDCYYFHDLRSFVTICFAFLNPKSEPATS